MIDSWPPHGCIDHHSLADLRSARERGLHNRAVKQGHALPCEISNRVIPMKTSADDSEPTMTSWPFLLPHNFEPGLDCYKCFFSV